MNNNSNLYISFVSCLKRELIPAMGCTEPIAIAFAAAKAREVLGCLPDKVVIQVSGSIIKNVKSVIVPNTDNMKGIKAAAAAGIVAGNASKQLEVLVDITHEDIGEIKAYLQEAEFVLDHVELGHVFDIFVSLSKGSESSSIRICDYHTNIVLIEKNGENIYHSEQEDKSDKTIDTSFITMENIWDFVTTCDINDVKDLMEEQIKLNTAIAVEGLKNNYGASVGKTIILTRENDVRTRAIAKAAAGSDARMNGCEMPVIINSGSGNQGITCSVPVVEYAQEYNASHEKLIRALVLSNLVSIYIKTGIGTLSAYCGAVSAATGAAAGMTYILDGSFKDVVNTVTNSLGTSSGIVCDGAKSSCASKIAASLNMSMLAYDMAKRNNVLKGGDGLVGETIEQTIKNIGILGREGMRQTNDQILDIMIHNN